VNVFPAIAALALASATSHSVAALVSAVPWWEKITVTISGDGRQQSCRFESSLSPNDSKICEVVSSQAALGESSGAKDQYTRITFERRFSPGGPPDAADLQPGDRLLGRQVMALAIDPKGAVAGCKIVATSGDVTPAYGCDEASAERFQTSAHTASAIARQGYMTILVYGHSEHVV
jgi:hypothetical protein